MAYSIRLTTMLPRLDFFGHNYEFVVPWCALCLVRLRSAVLQNFATANSSSRLQDLVVSRPAPIKGFAGQFVVLPIRNPGLVDDGR